MHSFSRYSVCIREKHDLLIFVAMFSGIYAFLFQKKGWISLGHCINSFLSAKFEEEWGLTNVGGACLDYANWDFLYICAIGVFPDRFANSVNLVSVCQAFPKRVQLGSPSLPLDLVVRIWVIKSTTTILCQQGSPMKLCKNMERNIVFKIWSSKPHQKLSLLRNFKVIYINYPPT